jgi:hypothetical protein
MPPDYIALIRRSLTEIKPLLETKHEPGSNMAIAVASATTRLAAISHELAAMASNLHVWQPGPSETKEK